MSNTVVSTILCEFLMSLFSELWERGGRSLAMTRLQAGRPGFDSRLRQGFLSSPPYPDWLWGPPSLLPNGYWEFFPWG